MKSNYEEDLKNTSFVKENRRHQEVSRHEDHQHRRVETQEREKHRKNVESKILEEKKLRFVEHLKQPEERYRPTTPKVKKVTFK